MTAITNTFSMKRLIAMLLGVATLSTSLLVGALTSAAAADEKARPLQNLIAAPMVETDTPIIERVATNDMRIDTKARFGQIRGDKFTTNPSHQLAGGCTIGFSDSDALLIQPEYAVNQFAGDPWRERCGNLFSEVTATNEHHLHLDYAAGDIGLCTNYDESLGGSYARLGTDGQGEQTCVAFDPLTEPRDSPRTHYSTEVVRFKMYDIDGYQPFRLNQIRVKDQPIRLCAQPVDVEIGIVMGGAQAGGMSGASCWTLTAGLWDLSNYTDNTETVTMTGAPGSTGPFSFDDINITDQS